MRVHGSVMGGRGRLACGMAVAALLLAACGGNGTTDTPTTPAAPTTAPTQGTPAATPTETDPGVPVPDGLDAELVAAAQAEGEVVVYSPIPISAAIESIGAQFREIYGITVTADFAHPRDHTERVLNEHRAGRPAADLVITGVSTGVQILAEGAIEPYQVAAIGELSEELVLFDEMSPLYANVYGLLVNTDIYPDPPSSFRDLLSGDYNGQVAMEDPRVSGGGSTFFVATHESPDLGLAFHEELAQIAEITSSDPSEAVARGDYGVYVSGQPNDLLQFESAPLTWVPPEEGIVAVTLSLGIISNAPHPNAAKLFAEFLVSEESQSALSEFVVPARPGVTLLNPMFDLGDAPFFPPISPTLDRNPFFVLAEEIYGVR